VIVRLLIVSGLELLIGIGVVAALGLPPGVSYLCGLALAGIVSAHLALIHIASGWLVLSILAGASLVVGGLKLWWERPVLRLRLPSLPGVISLVLLTALFLRAWPVFGAKPLNDYDGWAEWGMKAKALTLLGWADPHLFASRQIVPLNLDYPLLLPSLESIAARAMGSFDSRLIHLQFLLFAVAGLWALHALLRPRAPAWLVWPVLVAIAVAPGLHQQLLTAFADLPLALFVAAGGVAAARWLERPSPSLLALVSLQFAAATLTKKEGTIFVAAAYVALLVVSRRWRPLAVSVLAVALLQAPWQVWLRVHHVRAATSFSWQLLHHPGIAPLIARAILASVFSFNAWPLLLVGFSVAALAAAGTRLATFSLLWVFLSLGGIEAIYLTSSYQWSNYFAFSGARVVDSVVLGAAALTPLLATAVPGRARGRGSFETAPARQ
jgi:hypothetical protein